MRWFLSFLLLGLFAAVNALSSSGNRLLVVLEELEEKGKYSKFLGDLEGKCQTERGWINYYAFEFTSKALTNNHFCRSRIPNYCRFS
jgi:hypothetical protein